MRVTRAEIRIGLGRQRPASRPSSVGFAATFSRGEKENAPPNLSLSARAVSRPSPPGRRSPEGADEGDAALK